MDALLPPRRTVVVFCFVLLTLGFLVFGQSLRNEFVAWDDQDLIQGNPIVQSMNPATIGKAFSSYDPELYVPLTLLSLQLDHLLGGGSPVAFHLMSLLLHCLNALLVAWLTLLLLRKRYLAAAAGVLFLLHPIGVETVAWASARKDVLSATFLLLACITYVQGIRTGQRRLLLVGLFFLFALLSKASVIILPLLLLLIDGREGRRGWGIFREKSPLFALAVVFALIALYGKEHVIGALSPLQILLLIPKASLFVLGKILLPIKLAIFYPYTAPIVASSPDLLIHGAMLIVLLGVAWRVRKKYPEFLWGFLFFLIALAPNIVNFAKGERLGDIYLGSDRFTYVAWIGILIALLAFVDRWIRDPASQRGRIAGVCAGIVMLAFAVQSFGQVSVWRNTDSLFINVIGHYPDSQEAHGIVAGSLYAQGRLEEAVQEYATALSIRPTARAFFNLGVIFLDVDNYQASMDANLEALKLDPNASSAQMNIGVGYLKQQKFAEAITELQKVIVMDPEAGAAYVNIGSAYEGLGLWDDARAAYEKAIQVQSTLEVAQERLDTLEQRRIR
jgi:tetratricopeptide (TPR) repeat protein